MKYITEVREHKDAIQSLHCLVIYSSIRTCPPCRQLKTFMEKEYPDLENVYYVDIDLRSLKPLLGSISALPTLEFYQNGDKVKSIEGFDKHLIEDMIQIVYREPVEYKDMVGTTLLNNTPVHTQASSPVIQAEKEVVQPPQFTHPPAHPRHIPVQSPAQPRHVPTQPQQLAQLPVNHPNYIEKKPYAQQPYLPPQHPSVPHSQKCSDLREDFMESFPLPKKTKVDQMILDIQNRLEQ